MSYTFDAVVVFHSDWGIRVGIYSSLYFSKFCELTHFESFWYNWPWSIIILSSKLWSKAVINWSFINCHGKTQSKLFWSWMSDEDRYFNLSSFFYQVDLGTGWHCPERRAIDKRGIGGACKLIAGTSNYCFLFLWYVKLNLEFFNIIHK